MELQFMKTGPLLLLLATLTGCGNGYEAPTGWAESCDPQNPVCAPDMSCLVNPNEAEGVPDNICSFPCEVREDCPPGEINCGDGNPAACHEGVCVYYGVCA
ncbi:MAG TPA: hypothetical protein PLA94_02160 [Myxococcota bacterium]|nr:hypothetical protein [Myxococcota bacterium]